MADKNDQVFSLRANAYANIALCCLHLEDFSRGLKAAEISIRESLEPSTASEMLRESFESATIAACFLKSTTFASAIEHCETARHYAALSKSARAEILTSTIEGLC
jgi:hypothetical protein